MTTTEESQIEQQIYHAKSAIHLLVPNVPTASPHETIAQVEEKILANVKQYYSISYIYVVNHMNHLVGVLSIKDVYRLPKSKILQDVMITPVISVKPHAHRQTVCNLALQHKIKSIPVVDQDDKFLGVIPSDVILKVAYDELTEDILFGEGIQAKEYNSVATMTNSPFKLLAKRLPWLVAGLFGGLLAAFIVHSYEELLAQEALLVGFLPLIVYISDAVGSQSETIFIRSLAIDNKIKVLSYLFKEIRIGALIAGSLAALLVLVMALTGKMFLGVVVGASLFFTVIASICIAVMIPWLLISLKKDPAIGSGPFATILCDIISIMIYFYISQLLFSAI
jgi:magnesium transporter